MISFQVETLSHKGKAVSRFLFLTETSLTWRRYKLCWWLVLPLIWKLIFRFIFFLSQVDELEGWTNYMERYTAVKRKMDWILHLCELTWSTEHEITKNIDKDIFMDSFDFLIYRYIFSMCTSEVNCLFLQICLIFYIYIIYDYDFVSLNTHYM